MGLPEGVHTDQGAQFESELMTQLCRLWRIDKTRTTPYNPKGKGKVERNNQVLGDSLRSLLLTESQEDLDTLLPQLMRTLRATPHTKTGETANYMMYGRELRLPDHLLYDHALDKSTSTQEYVTQLQDRLSRTYQLLRSQQGSDKLKLVKSEGNDDPLQFVVGDMVLMLNKRRRKGEANKLVPRFVGPFKVVSVYPDTRTYKISRLGQESVQNESRLKLFKSCQNSWGQAPILLEPTRRPNMKGSIKRSQTKAHPNLELVPPRTGRQEEATSGRPSNEVESELSSPAGSKRAEGGQLQNETPAAQERPHRERPDFFGRD